MKPAEQRRALDCAVDAARAAGRLMAANLGRVKRVNETTRHDIKLELDVRCQRVIERKLRAQFPSIAILGEEGDTGDGDAEVRWVVDPIDGTVNFAYGIPHACVSIALQVRQLDSSPGRNRPSAFHSVVGVVYDPFQDELWTAIRGQSARLNGKVIHVSRRSKLGDSIVMIGFAKKPEHIQKSLPCFAELARRSRKIRITGAAALALTYVATARFDAYLERSVRLWDIAAGGLILECAGGEFIYEPGEEKGTFRMIATNGLVTKQLPTLP